MQWNWINKRNAAWGAGIVATAAALAWAFSPRPVQVEVAVVETGRFEQAIEEDGRTRLKDRYAVSAPVSARVARIVLREGDKVAAGDPVAVLTPAMSPMIDERSTREASARLKAAEAGIAAASARHERARVAQEEARIELQRVEKLTREGYLSAARLDSARLGLAGARRELEAAAAQREMAAHERAQAAAVLQPGTTRGGEPLVLRAPIAGVVLRVPQQSEATIAAGTTLLELGDPTRMEVAAQLLTTDAVQARPGTPVVVERWGGPALAGKVLRVEPAAFTKVSALGIEEQRVNVVVEIAEAPPAWAAVGDGFRVTVRVIIASAEGALLVPVGAVFPHGDGGFAVYRVEQGRATLRPVEIAARNGSVAWVRGGVAQGETLVLYPPPALADGNRVRQR